MSPMKRDAASLAVLVAGAGALMPAALGRWVVLGVAAVDFHPQAALAMLTHSLLLAPLPALALPPTAGAMCLR